MLPACFWGLENTRTVHYFLHKHSAYFSPLKPNEKSCTIFKSQMAVSLDWIKQPEGGQSRIRLRTYKPQTPCKHLSAALACCTKIPSAVCTHSVNGGVVVGGAGGHLPSYTARGSSFTPALLVVHCSFIRRCIYWPSSEPERC